MLDQPADTMDTPEGLACRRCGFLYLQRYDVDHLPQDPSQAMTLGMYLGAAILTHLHTSHGVQVRVGR